MSSWSASLFGAVWPGERIPPFELESTTGQCIRAAELRGRRLVLAFTGLAGSVRGRVLLVRLRRLYPVLQREGVVVLAIAPRSVDTRMLSEPGIVIPFPLLRDDAGLLHREFGAVDRAGQPAPSLFITDRFGRVTYRSLAGLGERLPAAAQILALVRFDELLCPHCGLRTRSD